MLSFKFVAAGTVAYLIWYIFGFVKSSGRPRLPPGPKGFPLLGNISDLPPSGEPEARHWLKHKSLYGAWLLSSQPFTSCMEIAIAKRQHC